MPRDAPLFCAMRQRAARYGLPPRHARRFRFRMAVARCFRYFTPLLLRSPFAIAISPFHAAITLITPDIFIIIFDFLLSSIIFIHFHE
jgi:hypothetical protein